MRYFLVLIAALFIAGTLNAQISFGISFNLESQPAWGPTGYDRAEYYYLPDIEAYYNVPLHRFYFYERGRWISRSSLPSRYHDYDLFKSYKVVVNERNPWRNHGNYREKYANYKGRRDQEPIRDSRDSKYFVNKYHPEHNNWIQQQKRDKGNQKDMRNNNEGDSRNRNNAQKQNNNDDKKDKGKNRK
jgi:hypothetical protein